MNDRLFPVDDIPAVPLFREPRRSRGAAISDERLAHDYPPDWHRCPTCMTRGKILTDPAGDPADGPLSDDLRSHALAGTIPDALAWRGWSWTTCPDCLGMGSVKARVRLEAGHRCVRCLHPYIPKGDAKMLGVDPTPYRWSPCDERCTHGGMIRLPESLDEGAREGFSMALPTGASVEKGLVVEAEWRILTVHHLDGDKANLAWWNLAALCQTCHLTIQGKVVMERVYPHPHSEWFQPYVAGWYAYAYLGEILTRDEVEDRMDELLALELDPTYA